MRTLYYLEDTARNRRYLERKGHSIPSGDSSYLIIGYYRDDRVVGWDGHLENLIRNLSRFEWEQYKLGTKSKRKSFKQWCSDVK